MLRSGLYSLIGFALLCFACIGAQIQKDVHLMDSATWIQSDSLVILGNGSGSDSAFFILGAIPVTKEPNVERAMSQILEKYPNGRSLINVVIQREDRPYFPLGLVTVINVTADVVGVASDKNESSSIPAIDSNKSTKGKKE